MKGRFRTKTGWRILIIVCGIPLAGLFGWILTTLSITDKMPGFVLMFLALLCLGVIGTMLYGILDSLFGYYEIGDDFVAQKTIFGKTVVPLSDIEGVDVNDNYIRLLPKADKKGMNISTYIQQSDEITKWAYSRFKDMGLQKVEEEDMEILKEVTLGVDAKDHDLRLEKARKIGRYLNWIGYVVGVWTLVFPTKPSYDVVVLICAIVPVVILGAVWWSKGFLRFNGLEKSRYPNMSGAFTTPVMALMVRVLLDLDIQDFGKLWLAAGAATAVAFLFLIRTVREFSFTTWTSAGTSLFVAVLLYIYAISSLLISNCRFDTSEPVTYKATILEKEVSSGKTTTYYLDLSPWGPRTEHDKVSVGPNTFERATVGDTVEIYLYPGKLGAQWFEIGV